MTRHASRTTIGTCLAALALAACSDAPSASRATTIAGHEAHANALTLPANAALQQDLAALRRATAAYHDVARARADKFADALTSCWYHGSMGGMGYHVGEAARIDATIDALKPEALLYEPLAGGKLSLAAVEYIVPIAAWTGTQPPSLFGRAFDRNDTLGLYVMHVWAWRQNPEGMFAPWNPKVSCQYATNAEDRGLTH